MRMHGHFAPLGLWTFVSHFPRALPWAVTLRAVGTEHMACRSDCVSLFCIVFTILPEQRPDESATLINLTFAEPRKFSALRWGCRQKKQGR